jgi:hypothetical protein
MATSGTRHMMNVEETHETGNTERKTEGNNGIH